MMCRSVPQIPVRSTRTFTSDGPHSGAGTRTSDSPGPGSVLRSAVIMSPAPGTEGPWSVRARSGLDTAAHLPADLGADGPSLCRAGAVGVPSRRRRTRDSKRGCHLRRPFEPPCAAIGRRGADPCWTEHTLVAQDVRYGYCAPIRHGTP